VRRSVLLIYVAALLVACGSAEGNGDSESEDLARDLRVFQRQAADLPSQDGYIALGDRCPSELIPFLDKAPVDLPNESEEYFFGYITGVRNDPLIFICGQQSGPEYVSIAWYVDPPQPYGDFIRRASPGYSVSAIISGQSDGFESFSYCGESIDGSASGFCAVDFIDSAGTGISIGVSSANSVEVDEFANEGRESLRSALATTLTNTPDAGAPATEIRPDESPVDGSRAPTLSLSEAPGADISGQCGEAASLLGALYPVDGGWTTGGGSMDGYSECLLTGDGPFSAVNIALGGPTDEVLPAPIVVGGWAAYPTEFPSNNQTTVTFVDARGYFLSVSIFNLDDRSVLHEVAETIIPLFGG
jgi:hypothetical protein